MKKSLLLSLTGLFSVLASLAQAPGGVATNLTLWLRSNSGTAVTGSLLDSWTYANDGTKTFTGTGAARPTLTPSFINFNPGVQFASTQILFGPTGANAPIATGDDDYTVFAVWRSNTVGAFQRVWSLLELGTGGADGASLATWNDGRYGDEVEVAPFDHTTPRAYTANTWNISQLNLLNQPLNDLQIIDDRNLSTAPVVVNTDNAGVNGAGLRDLRNLVHTIGGKLVAGEQALNGDVAEIIVYDRPISGTERNQVFSYLALKYGIPISTNIISSAGATIWNATTNSTYNNAVFGIGLDNGSGLNSTQSNSVVNGSGNGAGQSGKANLVISNPSALATNQNFLIVGNDNGGLVETLTNVQTSSIGSLRLGRQWKVQHTGNVGTVTQTFDLTGLTITGTLANNFRLAVDEDGDGNFTTGIIRYYTPASYTASVLTFNNVTLNNNEVFSLVTSAVGASLPVTWKSFTGRESNGDALLNWEVSDNAAAKDYEIQHSTDGVTYTKIGSVANQAAVTNYSFRTPLSSGNHYFRINQIDLDGKSSFSKVVTLRGSDLIIKLLKNPVAGFAELQINALRASKATVEVRTMAGATVVKQNASLTTGGNRLKIPLDNAAAGNYTLTVQWNGMIYNTKITKL